VVPLAQSRAREFHDDACIGEAANLIEVSEEPLRERLSGRRSHGDHRVSR
jgi:hypothetical protein